MDAGLAVPPWDELADTPPSREEETPLPLPLSMRTCRCGRQLDMFGHHRAVAGVLGKRGFPVECAAAQVCREAGARVSTNIPVREMDLAAHHNLDVADGLTLWHGAQLAIDTTLVSPLRRDGSARFRAADQDGAVLMEARRQKERTYPELSGEGGRARLMVLAAEVGGRWGDETAKFLAALANAQAQASPFILQNRVKAAYLRRWSAVLACSAARAFTASLLDQRPVSGWEETRLQCMRLCGHFCCGRTFDGLLILIRAEKKKKKKCISLNKNRPCHISLESLSKLPHAKHQVSQFPNLPKVP